MPDVYISCSSRDEASARRLMKALKEMGISSRCSEGDVVLRDNTIPLMPAALRGAEFFVILISRSALKSERVRAELKWAGENKLPLLPVRLDQTPLYECFDYYLHAKQWIIADRKMTAAASELAALIEANGDPDPSAIGMNGEKKADFYYKDDKKFVIRVVVLALICMTYLVAGNILRVELGNSDLYWNVDGAFSLVLLVVIVVLFAPLYGGYKTFLRMLLGKLWDAIRGKNKERK